MKNFLILYLCSSALLYGQNPNFDQDIIISTNVDTTEVKIGEELNFKIDISSKNKYNISFDEIPNFMPFEILESFDTDTIQESSTFSKRYSLINFEPGEYWIPPQKIYFNQSIKYSDSLLIVVNDVEVDTLKQNLYDIKPIIPVKRNYQNLLLRIFIAIIVGFLVFFLYRYYLLKKNIKPNEEEKSLFELANEKLENLNSLDPNSQIEFKEYYTILIDIFREYLESQIKIPAMESTSKELILRINLLRDSGNYNFEKSKISKLESLFTKSDLVKFAKSLPTKSDIKNDLDIISDFIDDTEKIYNEKFNIVEDIEPENEEYSIIDDLKTFLKYSFLILSSILLISILLFGYYPVRDTILMNPTKILMSKDWFTSQYGSPPVELNSPNILVRSNDTLYDSKFVMGDFKDAFFLTIDFKDVVQVDNNPSLDLIKNDLINQFQTMGSKNILLKDDQFTIKSGDTGLRLFGSLDIEIKNRLIRSNFTTVILPYDKKTIRLTIVHRADDRYADNIKSRILESFDIVKEL